MSGVAIELVEKVKSYLQEHFPGREVSEELDPSRDVVELRVSEPDGRTLLAEIPSKHLEGADAKAIAGSLDKWNLAQEMRDNLRVLVTPGGLEPLPWKQLPAERDGVEEASEESFPASDPVGHSAATPERRR
jgi:hypothetical protein